MELFTLQLKVSVNNSIKNPNIFVETNVIGTLNLLNASLHFGQGDDFRFLHVSADHACDQLCATDLAFRETTPLFPNSSYSGSKPGSD